LERHIKLSLQGLGKAGGEQREGSGTKARPAQRSGENESGLRSVERTTLRRENSLVNVLWI
jgi:hypothetical protein